MTQALALGRRSMGQTWPNPAVGCILIKNGCVVGRAWTQPGGRPHAETQALAMAGATARGATAYVTLEPCAHHGKTPPCADALIAAGVRRVVSPLHDQDPRVSGRGFERLRAAGIEVVTGICAEQAAMDHAGFFLRLSQNRPWVTLKLALSLDGRIATGSGESKWITGPLARKKVHALRATHDAVLVGGGTARADDPQLTVRGLGQRRQPVRIVISRSANIDTAGQLATSAKECPVWICHGPNAQNASQWDHTNVSLIECDLAAGRLDMRSVLRRIAEKGLTRVFCEGGGQIASSLIANDLVDELHVFSAGVVIGAEGIPGLGSMGIAALGDAPRFDLVSQHSVGPDMHHIWRRCSVPEGR